MYAPDAGAELAAADVGEEEIAQDKPRLKRKPWSRLLGMLLCVAVLWGVLYWLRQGEDVAVEKSARTVETATETDVEPTEDSNVRPIAPDAEEVIPASQEEATGDSTRAGGEKAELNEPPAEKEESVRVEGGEE